MTDSEFPDVFDALSPHTESLVLRDLIAMYERWPEDGRATSE